MMPLFLLMEIKFKKAKKGQIVKYYPNYQTGDHAFKKIQEVTTNQIILEGGMRFRRHDGSAIAPGNTAYIER